MGLPVNIQDLVHGKAIEWERLEFKKGWNPEEIIHTICAFANDLNNWGGGYIIIGIEEENGQPKLPPFGIHQNQLDKIQGEVLKLSHQISPHYYPLMHPFLLDEKYVIVLWCPAGDNRPYTAPSVLMPKAQRYSYIRFGSRSIIAKDENLRHLYELAARIPFDDRVNGKATLQDFDLSIIQAFLHQIKSDLFEESKKLSLAQLTRRMLIAKGPDEDLRPVNVGLLFFSQNPDQFFPRCWIELVWHKDHSGKNFIEKYFKGPVHYHLKAALDFIQNNVIREVVEKIPDEAEANRYYNFPFTALEESLSNAVYHKSYEIGNPVEVQIWPDKIEILSYPGPVPPVDAQILQHQKRIIARDYRNRRIGDFLKELDLTEGRGTGFPTIYMAMENNGSPEPVFETNQNCTYFLTVLHSRIEKTEDKQPDNLESDQAGDQASDQVKPFDVNDLDKIISLYDQANDQAGDQAGDQANRILKEKIHDKVAGILEFTQTPRSRAAIFEFLEITNHTKNRKKYLDPLIQNGWIEMTLPDKPTHPQQRYKITDKGKKLLKLIS